MRGEGEERERGGSWCGGALSLECSASALSSSSGGESATIRSASVECCPAAIASARDGSGTVSLGRIATTTLRGVEERRKVGGSAGGAAGEEASAEEEDGRCV